MLVCSNLVLGLERHILFPSSEFLLLDSSIPANVQIVSAFKPSPARSKQRSSRPHQTATLCEQQARCSFESFKCLLKPLEPAEFRCKRYNLYILAKYLLLHYSPVDCAR